MQYSFQNKTLINLFEVSEKLLQMSSGLRGISIFILWPVWCKAISWINAVFWSSGPLGTSSHWTLTQTEQFSFNKIYLNMSSANSRWHSQIHLLKENCIKTAFILLRHQYVKTFCEFPIFLLNSLFFSSSISFSVVGQAEVTRMYGWQVSSGMTGPQTKALQRGQWWRLNPLMT